MKRHLHILVVERGLAKTEQEARAKVMAAQVLVDGQPITKAGYLVDEAADISLKEKSRYVSRGGAKLASVAAKLKLNFNDKVVLDVGSSTGGFTDFALQNGAKRVFAVDSGNAQLDFKLRLDSRVVSMERTDIRDVTELDESVDITVMDVSFVSATKLLEAVVRLVGQTPLIVMVKPQFEAAKHATDATKGVVTDPAMRTAILKEFERTVDPNFEIQGSADSKIHGAKGNVERFYILKARDSYF